MRKERLLLLVAYIILVLVTVTGAWRTDRLIREVHIDLCSTAEITIANQVATLIVFGDQPGVNSAARDEVLEVYLDMSRALERRCDTPLFDLYREDFDL